MAEETEFGVIESHHLIWPGELQLPSKRFRLFVAADTTRATTDQISDFAEAGLERGAVYFCAWGPGCERFHDIFDQVEIGTPRFAPPTPNDVVMTTWHDHETLEEALEFYASCAVPSDGYAAESHYRLAICVGNPEWAAVAIRFLKTAKFLE
jgi:hypothetical protein